MAEAPLPPPVEVPRGPDTPGADILNPAPEAPQVSPDTLAEQHGGPGGAIRAVAEGDGLGGNNGNAGAGGSESGGAGGAEGDAAGAGDGGGKPPEGPTTPVAPEGGDEDPAQQRARYDALRAQVNTDLAAGKFNGDSLAELARLQTALGIPDEPNASEAPARAETGTTDNLQLPQGAEAQAAPAARTTEAGGAGTGSGQEGGRDRTRIVDVQASGEAQQPVEDKRTTEQKLNDSRENIQKLEASRKAAMKEFRANPSPENLQQVEDVEENLEAERIHEKSLEVDQLAEAQEGKDPREKQMGAEMWKKVQALEARQRAIVKKAGELPLRVAELLPLKREARQKLQDARKEEGRMNAQEITTAEREEKMKTTQDARHELMLVCTDIVNNRFAAERYALEYNELDNKIAATTGEVGVLGRLGSFVLNKSQGYVLDRVISRSIEEEMARDGSVIAALKNPLGQMSRARMYASA